MRRQWKITGATLIEKCDAECCSNVREPYQPEDERVLRGTRHQTGNKKEYRAFNKKWYKQYPWLTLCTTRNSVFCYICRFSAETNQLALSKNTEPAFTKDGFSNWKKATSTFSSHESSSGHKEASFIVQRIKAKEAGINEMINDHSSKVQESRRRLFLKELSSLRMLLRQGLAVRGHTEEEGNLTQLLLLQTEDDADLKTWLSNKQYLSGDIINECISSMGHYVLRDILIDIYSAGMFAVLADETRDISNKEQLTICIRWVASDKTINEDFVGMVHVEKTDADTLVSVIKDVLIRCSLPLAQCKGQGYDGASAMMGHLRGVAAQIRKEAPAAIQVHCFAHCLNLCLQDAAKTCNMVRDCLSLITEICKLICNSPKRSLVFEKFKRDHNPDTTGLRPLCPTRWTVRTAAIGAVLENYEALMMAFAEINEESHDDHGRRAGGILSQMEKFETFFGLKFSHMLFASTEEVSFLLQSKSTTLQDGIQQVAVAKEFLARQRSDEAFDKFYETVVNSSKDHTDPPTLPRVRRLPKRLDDGSNPHVFSTPADYYRKMYFEVIDLLLQELSRRFDQASLAVPLAVEKMLLDAANWDGKGTFDVDKDAIQLYSENVDMNKLVNQLKMLPDYITEIKKSVKDFASLKKVTTIRSLGELLSASSFGSGMLSEVDKLLKIYLTLPVSTASAERSFSCLRRLKTYLRSTMTQQRLNNMMLLHCHKARTDAIDLTVVARDFAIANERRLAFFGNF